MKCLPPCRTEVPRIVFREEFGLKFARWAGPLRSGGRDQSNCSALIRFPQVRIRDLRMLVLKLVPAFGRMVQNEFRGVCPPPRRQNCLTNWSSARSRS